MKKLIFFAAGILLLAACSKKSDPRPAANPNAKFVGSWDVTIDSTYLINNGKTTGSALTYNGNYVWQLNADGSGKLTESGEASIPVTYTINGDMLKLSVLNQG